jgi:7-cyano-7-deazaguanine synthase
MVADLSCLGKLGGSSLTDESMSIERGESIQGEIPSTYVPFRNTLFLSIAVSWAEVLDVKKVFIGAVESDSTGYPDCRKRYFEAFGRVVKLGTRSADIRIFTPLVDIQKSEIVRIGIELKAPLQLTWSCYDRTDFACGECESCVLRLKGFREAGFTDPISYVKL